jgi:hypothetical protein
MSADVRPVICFGQQPCGFFPRRFLYAKFVTARKLQAEIGGEIVFFCHDSDHDPRETQTTLRHRKTDAPHAMNFAFENKLQRKYSPLFLKRIPAGWRENTARQLGAYVAPPLSTPSSNPATTVADFCLEMYRRHGPARRHPHRALQRSRRAPAACDITDCFVDVPHQGEIVRARLIDGALKLHEGGEAYTTLPVAAFTKAQVSPTRDSRLGWMQSVIHCTHYIAGLGEQAYLNKADAPDITFCRPATPIDRSDEAYAESPLA